MATPQVKPPFNPQHLAVVNEGLRHIYDARQMMTGAEAIGANVDMHRQAADQLEEWLTAWKQQYAPGAK